MRKSPRAVQVNGKMLHIQGVSQHLFNQYSACATRHRHVTNCCRYKISTLFASGMLARIKLYYTVIIRMCCSRLCTYF